MVREEGRDLSVRPRSVRPLATGPTPACIRSYIPLAGRRPHVIGWCRSTVHPVIGRCQCYSAKNSIAEFMTSRRHSSKTCSVWPYRLSTNVLECYRNASAFSSQNTHGLCNVWNIAGVQRVLWYCYYYNMYDQETPQLFTICIRCICYWLKDKHRKLLNKAVSTVRESVL